MLPIRTTAPVTWRDGLRFSAAQLPPGVAIHETTGIVSGTTTSAGEYNVQITAEKITDQNQRHSIKTGFFWSVGAAAEPTLQNPGTQEHYVGQQINLASPLQEEPPGTGAS